MEGEASTSHEANNAATELKRWTRDLHGLPAFSYELLIKHCGIEHSGAGAQKHKKLGYQLFKDKYVGQVQVKKNVTKGNMVCFLVKGCVNAAMKNNVYTVYVHLNEANGEVVHTNCTCTAGKGGQCKHVVALLFQIIEYKQLDMTEIPDTPTCTELLQQWHVPRKDESDKPVLYENIPFKKATYEKDIGKKRKNNQQAPIVHNPIPQFAQNVTKPEVQKLANSLIDINEKSYLGNLLMSNDCEPYPFQSIHVDIPSKKRHTESMQLEINYPNVRDKILKNLQPTTNEETVNWQYENIKILHSSVKISYEEILEIERNTREQSSEDRWFEERGKRLTSSNFGPVVKRRQQRYPKTIMSNIKSSRSKCPKQCQWGKDKECEAIREYAKLKKSKETWCMAVLKVSWCDFVVFTNVDLYIERVYFDNDFWCKIVPELSNFYAEYMLPEL
ncbi:uncharacterized protein LOC114541314 [Dendronephthya gigantea]|uniref:uncharacterized protein LOC114541314 n=1 Tax=Dendronephthya gigantea TaxID=151771 RepID=UPI00106AB8C1|nr:uncharacterized protein LOC114541314 [Dendronephthya gigantea]